MDLKSNSPTAHCFRLGAPRTRGPLERLEIVEKVQYFLFFLLKINILKIKSLLTNTVPNTSYVLPFANSY